MAKSELETLRALFKDDGVHVTVAVIKRVTVASDRSALFVDCQLAFEERTVVATMGWDCLNHESGAILFPDVGDAVLVAFADADADHAFVIKRLTSREEKLPIKAVDGHLVVQAPAGKKTYLASDTKVLIGKKDNDPTEPLVLGNVQVAMWNDILSHIMNQAGNYQIGFCAVGPVYLLPEIVQKLVDDIQKYLTDNSTNIISQLAYTERGT